MTFTFDLKVGSRSMHNFSPECSVYGQYESNRAKVKVYTVKHAYNEVPGRSNFTLLKAIIHYIR